MPNQALEQNRDSVLRYSESIGCDLPQLGRSFRQMTYKDSTTVIGYSVFDLFEECYGYSENACFIADSRAAAQQFVEHSLIVGDEFRIDAVTIDEIMNDFGFSFGEFAMEAEAFRRFKAVAAVNGIDFEATPYYGEESLMVVKVEEARHPRED
jgi:hypothetical protein